ncbi:MAG: GHKL domain-containing protein [Clostridia bacterium]|nr:GHKL domain-containing protein [Clostridia bacterium]
MLALSAALLIATASAGVFLRAKPKTILFSALTGLAVGDAMYLLAGRAIPTLLCFAAGEIAAALLFLLLEKRNILDALIMTCVGISQYGLWTVLYDGLSAAMDAIVLFLFCVLLFLHVPALLLSFDSLRLPTDWHRKTKGLYRVAVPIVGVCVLLMTLAILWLDASGTWLRIARILLCAAVFWMGILLMTLLVSGGRDREQNEAQNAYHDDMNTFMNVVRSQRHDYNLHVQTVASLIAQEKWDECRSYVNALVQDTNRMNEVLPVKDPAVAALIHNYRILCAQNGIKLVMDIRDDLKNVVTTAYETNKLIGNLLQNALDELSQQPEPGEIELSIFKRGEYDVMRVSNRVTDPEAFQARQSDIFRQGFTTKQGHDGVGLSSIKALANEKGGDVSVWTEGDVVHFAASVPVRMISEEKES